jgi:hypothetical protein
MHLKNKFFIHLALILILLTSCSEEKKLTLCTDEILNFLISRSYTSEYDSEKFWNKIKEHGYISESEDEHTRTKFVNMQFLFESTLASMLKYKQASKAIAVVYTPIPSTPLRTDGTNLDEVLSKEALRDPDIINTIVSRYESLHEYLKNNGVLYNIYKNINNESEVPGMDMYNKNLKQYPNNLIDKPTDDFEKEYSGASYLVECDNGQQIFFSISASALNDNSEKKHWEIYYGSLENSKIHSHFKALKNLYNKSGADFDLHR